MFGAPKIFRYLPCALWQFVFVCIARGTVLSTKTRHIILQYVQRNSKDMRNILRYKMDARCLWQFVFFSSAYMVLNQICINDSSEYTVFGITFTLCCQVGLAVIIELSCPRL